MTQSETFEAEQPHRLPLATIAIERIPPFRRVAWVAVVLVGGGWGVHADKKQYRKWQRRTRGRFHIKAPLSVISALTNAEWKTSDVWPWMRGHAWNGEENPIRLSASLLWRLLRQ